MISSILLVVSPLLGTPQDPIQAQEASGTTAPPVATVLPTRRKFTVTVEHSGSFVPADAAEISLWPKTYSGALRFTEVVPHGTFVNEGDVIARFDTESIEEQLRDAEMALRAAQVEHENTVERIKIEEEAAAENLRTAEAELARAERSLEGWLERELEFARRGDELSDQGARHNIEDQQDELDQLEAMYREDELTDATEEIVLKRSRRQLAFTKSYLELNRARRAYTEEYERAMQTERREEAVRNQRASLERLVRSQALDRRSRDIRLEQSAEGLRKKTEHYEELRADQQLFAIRSPRSGLLLHGSSEDFEPGRGGKRFESGDSASTRESLFTVADPDDLGLALTVPESQIATLASGVAAKVRPVVTENREYVGRLQVERFPTASSAAGPENQYEARVVFDQRIRGIVPGMRAKVELVTEELDDVFVVPVSAVFGEGDETCCYAATGTGFERLSIRVGPKDGNEVVVYGDLTEGQPLMLVEPGS